MAKSEWIYDKSYGAYYYLTSDGYYARNTWWATIISSQMERWLKVSGFMITTTNLIII